MAPPPDSLCRQAQHRGSRISSRRAYDRNPRLQKCSAPFCYMEATVGAAFARLVSWSTSPISLSRNGSITPFASS